MLIMNNGHFTFYAKRPPEGWVGNPHDWMWEKLTENCSEVQARARRFMFMKQQLVVVFED